MGAPFFYDHINAATAAEHPSIFRVHDNATAAFFKRYLLQKAISVFEWQLPKTWSKDYFLYTLYSAGYIAIVNTDKFGVIPQGCGLRGYDVFYRPTHAIITNPLLSGIVQPRIGSECVLIKLQPDYHGVLDLVNHYGDLMALATESIGMNLENSHLAYVFTASNKAGAESFKKLYDKIAAGDPAVVYDKTLLNDDGTPAWQTFTQNLRQNYIVSDLLSDLRKIESEYDTHIGIPNANTDKRERLITDEVNANNTETASKVALWLEQCHAGCDEAKRMFGIDLSVKKRFEEVASDGESNAVPAGNL